PRVRSAAAGRDGAARRPRRAARRRRARRSADRRRRDPGRSLGDERRRRACRRMSGVRESERALVTGASGFIGRHLAEHLLREGVRVRVLVRDARRWRGPRTEMAVGDLADRAALRNAVRGVDRVYHVAGLTKARREADYFTVNHLGTVHLLQACLEVNPALRRFVLVSSQAAAGPVWAGRPVTEHDPPRPVSAYGWSKLRAEQAALACSPLLPITIVRPPVVYGPRDRDTLLVFRAARFGLVPRLGPLACLSIVHVDDLVRGTRCAGEHP